MFLQYFLFFFLLHLFTCFLFFLVLSFKFLLFFLLKCNLFLLLNFFKFFFSFRLYRTWVERRHFFGKKLCCEGFTRLDYWSQIYLFHQQNLIRLLNKLAQMFFFRNFWVHFWRVRPYLLEVCPVRSLLWRHFCFPLGCNFHNSFLRLYFIWRLWRFFYKTVVYNCGAFFMFDCLFHNG